jgi:hypothetical protein
MAAHVRFAPKADKKQVVSVCLLSAKRRHSHCSRFYYLFDRLVGEDVELRRNGKAVVASRAVGVARWHCVRYVMAITEKRFPLPNCAKRTAHS